MLKEISRRRFFVTLLFCLSVLLILIISFFSYRNIQLLSQSRAGEVGVRESILEYEKLLSSLKDAEAGQRSYLLTGDSAYLYAYHYALDSISVITGRINTRTETSRVVHHAHARINQLMERKLSALQKTAVARSRNGLEGVLPLIKGQPDKYWTDSIRVEIKQLQSYKLQLLNGQTRSLSNRSQLVMRGVVAGAAAGILMLTWAFIWLLIELRKRQKAFLELEQHNDTLEARVQKRTHDLQESEAKLRPMFESDMMGVIFYDLNGSILEANNSFLRMIGYSREELEQGQVSWSAMTPPEYLAIDQERISQMLEYGACTPYEKEYIRKDGTRLPILIGYTLFEGSREKGVAFILDITEQKIAREKLRKSERLQYEVFENSADALFLLNARGNIVEDCNQQAVVLFDLDNKAQFLGKEAQNLQKRPFAPEEEKEIYRELQEKGYWTHEIEYVSLKGRSFWGNAAVSLIAVNEEHYYLIRIRDVTERRQFEEKLRKNEQLLESIFENVADGLFLIEPKDSRIVRCNQRAVKLFEFTCKEEMIGLRGNEFQKRPFTEDELHQVRREVWQKRYWSSEIEYVTRRGTIFWGDMAITIVSLDDKDYLLIRVSDITERKHYQEILRRNQEELIRQKQRTEEVLALMAEDNERKTRELEEARVFQLSMLPQEPPSLGHLEMAMFMKTSAEVGGDYYDYKLHENGDLTVVIGDATGHGLKAGIIVATVKSYFQTLADRCEAVELLERISEGIQNLQVRGMYMGLTVIHVRGHQLTIASSGMPPLYLYRHHTGTVETILLKGVFLGSRLDVPLQQIQVTLQPRDTLLAITDGLPELFNRNREMLGYPQIEGAFLKTGQLYPQLIIDHLLAMGETWTGGYQNQDDITMIVLKAK